MIKNPKKLYKITKNLYNISIQNGTKKNRPPMVPKKGEKYEDNILERKWNKSVPKKRF